MKGNSNRPKGVVACAHQIDLGEEATSREVMGVIVDVTGWISVGNGLDVKSSIVIAWAPAVVLPWHDMESL
jgi:polynucleotide 5'-kinase involved in rRNA processing